MARLAVFIDGGYLDALLKYEFAEVRIDYQALVAEIVGDHELLRTYYYHCPPYESDPITPEERERKSKKDIFFNYLRRLDRFEVRLGKLHRYYDENGNPEYKQKRVDTFLAIDLVLLATKRRIEEAVLIAGDSDFLPAVETARNEGVGIHLYHCERYHNDLWDLCDKRTQIRQPLISRIQAPPALWSPPPGQPRQP